MRFVMRNYRLAVAVFGFCCLCQILLVALGQGSEFWPVVSASVWVVVGRWVQNAVGVISGFVAIAGTIYGIFFLERGKRRAFWAISFLVAPALVLFLYALFWRGDVDFQPSSPEQASPQSGAT
jgi:hypothetical protein